MKVSIITPFFNAGVHLNELADSIINQTHTNWEWILVDDGSANEEWLKVQSVASSDLRISAMSRAYGKPKGACACRNTGLDQSSGDYLLFLDSDDYLSPNCLEKRLKAVHNAALNPNELFYFQTAAFTEGEPKMILWDDVKHPMEWLESVWNLKPPCQSSGPLWPAETIKSIGGWNEEMAVWQDLEIHTRAYLKGIRFVDAVPLQPDVYYRISSNSLSHKNFHSPEKTKSRFEFVCVCLSSSAPLTEGQKKALTVLAFSVLKALIAQKDWTSAQQIAQLCEARIGKNMMQLFQQSIYFHRMKIYKMPLLKAYSSHIVQKLGISSVRKILARPYLSHWPSVTILIPTFNAMGWFRNSYAELLKQDYAGEWDVLVIDSGSTDGTIEFLKNQPRTAAHSIPSEEFGHGKTRNLGASMAKGDLVLMTVQDARPRSIDWMTRMVHALESNGLDGVCGKQAVPSEDDKNPLQWYRPLSEPNEDDVFDAASIQEASPEETMKACSWDNVNALYRKSSLLARPFRDVRFGEDMFWALDMLKANGKIGYTHQSKVWHYHHQRPGFTRKRVFYTHYWRYQAFGCLPELQPMWGISHTMRALKTLIWHARIFNPVVLIKWLNYNHQIAKESTEITEEFLKAVQSGDAALNTLYASFGAQSPMATPTQSK